jgi:hypothetical protein
MKTIIISAMETVITITTLKATNNKSKDKNGIRTYKKYKIQLNV